MGRARQAEVQVGAIVAEMQPGRTRPSRRRRQHSFTFDGDIPVGGNNPSHAMPPPAQPSGS
eukprot:CAMPEP_0180539128 /NCGR_PEP_ID=MMETSP1036_2-20121128/66724_1 /TAXON_ID=632150 /ORGANISM="Azadinium spinosum, Strain 3D9" /LENGTH=60 /DNA_ID=CAMNT_0022553849 /DNA_START=39 /DNA_END=219 /DNA_ORIENTATION=-